MKTRGLLTHSCVPSNVTYTVHTTIGLLSSISVCMIVCVGPCCYSLSGRPLLTGLKYVVMPFDLTAVLQHLVNFIV